MYTRRLSGRWPAKSTEKRKTVVRRLSYVWQTNSEATTVFIKRKPLSKRFVKLTGAQKGPVGEINGMSSDFGEGCKSHLEVLHHSAINPTRRACRRMLNGLFMAVTPRCIWNNRPQRGSRSKWKVERGANFERRCSQATVSFCNKTKVPLDCINGLSRGDVKLRCGGAQLIALLRSIEWRGHFIPPMKAVNFPKLIHPA